MPNSCQICGQQAQGTHFGVKSCRACSAFFRRYGTSKLLYTPCQRKIGNWKTCYCRSCRLQKCVKMGMSTEKFQYNRDSLISNGPRFSVFSAHPEFSIFLDSTSPQFKTFIDTKNLIFEATRLLNFGPDSPIFSDSQLKKLSLGSKFLRLDSKNLKIFGNFGKSEFVDIIEFYFVSVIKWILFFDEFQKLDKKDQMTLIYSIWHMWMKYHKCSCTAMFKKLNGNAEQHVLRNTVMDREKAKMDTDWMSDYPTEYVSIYMKSQNIHETEITDSIMKLEPTDTELTYLFAQSCFEYAGKRFQGEIQSITDHFQQILSNDLHNYYVVEQKNSRYSYRLAELMKINNLLQKSKWESRPQRELNKVFNVVKIGYSHPEMFKDSQFY